MSSIKLAMVVKLNSSSIKMGMVKERVLDLRKIIMVRGVRHVIIYITDKVKK